jgi:hypothetical protein
MYEHVKYLTMKEIRDIKIDLVMGNKNPIIDLFCEITNGLGIINCNVYNDEGMEFIYYNREGEWIFYRDCKNEKFWAHYKRYWVLLESYFDLEYREIQAITKLLVEEMIKQEVGTPYAPAYSNLSVVEEALKREVATPHRGGGSGSHRVEEAIKREVSTPHFQNSRNTNVEEVLKRELTTAINQ